MVGRPLQLHGSPSVRYSFNQVVFFDDSEGAPGSSWTEEHWRQGFARRETVVAFATIRQAGIALLNACYGSPDDSEPFERLISVPLRLPTGKLRIEGPEEYPIDRFIELPPGEYVVILGQRFGAHQALDFHLFVDAARGRNSSQILKADQVLDPPPVLLESADPA